MHRSAALYNIENLHRVRHSAPVLGPSSRPLDLAPLAIVLLVVEDIGIERVFLLIQTLVRRYEESGRTSRLGNVHSKFA